MMIGLESEVNDKIEYVIVVENLSKKSHFAMFEVLYFWRKNSSNYNIGNIFPYKLMCNI